MKAKIKDALNEARILVLGVQVLAGIEYEAVFERRFAELPQHAQLMMIGSLWLMLAAFILLMAPAAYHRIVERGGTSHRFNKFITGVTAPALLPFAIGMAANFYVALLTVDGRGLAVTAAVAALIVAVVFWYGLEFAVRLRQRRRGEGISMQDGHDIQTEDAPTPLPERITMVMTEARVVLPGAQALLGFQFIVTLMEKFEGLSPLLKSVHLISLGLVALSTIFLMAPAAYHRIVEEGQDTERVHHFASIMVLAAMAVLAPGLCGDFFVVSVKVLGSLTVAAALAFATLVLFYGFWFGYMLYVRAHRSTEPTSVPVEQANAA